MNHGKLAEANHQQWGLPYVMGWHILVRCAKLQSATGGPVRVVYMAYRRRTGWPDYPEKYLGECDAKGYPLPTTIYQLTMAL